LYAFPAHFLIKGGRLEGEAYIITVGGNGTIDSIA